jgi:hypothetical protein
MFKNESSEVKDQIPMHVQDGAMVGRSDILSSPNVTEAPPRINRPVPVPSVYKDERGEIHNFRIGDRRLNLLYTKAGVMRSGDLHKDSQHDFVFSGEVEVLLLEPDGSTSKTVYKDNEYIRVPPYTPHIFRFVQDTVVAEWWDGHFHSFFYEPYRAIVEKTITEKKEPGHFAHYSISLRKQHGLAESLRFINLPGWWAGIVAGMAIGYMLGKRR